MLKRIGDDVSEYQRTLHFILHISESVREYLAGLAYLFAVAELISYGFDMNKYYA